MARVEHWLHRPDLQIVGADEPPRGIQGARVLTLRIPGLGHGLVFRAKWRAYSTTNEFNVPRRELAAYAVQSLFLQRSEYVVPPSAACCLDLARYRAHVDQHAGPTFEGTHCVFGFLQYWLEAAKTLDAAADAGWLNPEQGPLDRELFARDGTYKLAVARLNLLTYLIDHDDSHEQQFLLSGGPGRLHLYSVDNSMSFDSRTNPELSPAEDWSRIQVPALPEEAIERLRQLQRRDIDALRALEWFELRDGMLKPIESPEADERSGGALAWHGRRLSVGLTDSEIDQVWRRVRALRDSVARRIVQTFTDR